MTAITQWNLHRVGKRDASSGSLALHICRLSSFAHTVVYLLQIHRHIRNANHPSCTPSECMYLSLPESVSRTLQCWPPGFGAMCIAVGVGRRTVVIQNTSGPSQFFTSVTVHNGSMFQSWQQTIEQTHAWQQNWYRFFSYLKIRLTWTTFKYPALIAQ